MSKPAVFLDRDGTLIEHYEYLTDPSDVQMMPSVAPAMKLLRDRGFLLVMISNQSAVARGIITEKKLIEIHDTLKVQMSEQNVYLDKMYYCPYHPEAAVEKYRKDSELRKPKPGMLHLAAQELDIDLSRSWMVGDDDRDVLAGKAAKCRTILLESYGSVGVQRGSSEPDFKAVNLQEAANLIVRYTTSRRIPPAEQEETSEEITTQSNHQGAGPMGNHENTEHTLSTHRQELDTESYENESLVVNRDASGIDEAEVDEPIELRDPELQEELLNERQLLQQILRELKSANRESNYSDFSIANLFAGIIQIVVVFFMVLAFMFGNGAEPKPESVQTCLLWAGVFQLLTMTLLLIHKQ